MPEVDPDEVARLRVSIAKIARQMQRQAADDGLTRTQLSVLGTIAREGPLGLGRLAEIEGLNPTLVSRVVAKLDEAGIIRRRPAAGDRRAAVVEVTPAGARLHVRLRRARTAMLAERLDRIGDADACLVLRALPALERLADGMSSASAMSR